MSEQYPLGRAITIPDDFTVYAVADIHGVHSGLVAVLRKAGLIDVGDHWCAPARTALVALGDSIDRGTHSLAVLDLLSTLRAEATGAGSVVALLEGNHEQIARDGLSGQIDFFAMWLRVGGLATLRDIGLDEDSRALARGIAAVRSAVDGLAPAFRPFLYAVAPYARFRDITLVHAGWQANVPDLAAFAAGSDRLWLREEFLVEADLDSPAYHAYAAAGLARLVVGHTPIGPALFQDGRVFLIDSNCAASPDMDTPPQMSLVRLPDDPRAPLSECELTVVSTADAPDRQQARR